MTNHIRDMDKFNPVVVFHQLHTYKHTYIRIHSDDKYVMVTNTNKNTNEASMLWVGIEPRLCNLSVDCAEVS